MLLKKVARRISSHGARDTLRWIRSHVDSYSRENNRCIDTRGWIDPQELPVNDCFGYEPISYECLDRIFESIEVVAGDVLLDYGSGKGRVLIEAAGYPFTRILGVEYDKELVDCCTENVKRFDRSLLDARVQIYHVDAEEFNIPQDTNFIFLWNSFVGDVLSNVKEKILLHADSRPNPVNLILALPSGETESLERFSDLTFVRKIGTRFSTGIDLYHFVG